MSTTRREFLQTAGLGLCATGTALAASQIPAAQPPQQRPPVKLHGQAAPLPPLAASTSMIRDRTTDWAVLQSGYWRLEVDLARPRVASLRADPFGLAQYCHEILEPDEGGETEMETEDGFVRSRDSTGHRVEQASDGGLLLRRIALGNLAQVDWHLSLAGTKGEVLRVRVERQLLRPVRLVTDTPFAWKCLREFAFWSHPSLRFGHDPAGPIRLSYSSNAEVAQRRVIGYHAAQELPEFFVHGSPVFPDLRMRLDHGWHHLEMRYARHVKFGVSSRDFSGGAALSPGDETWSIEFHAVPQGEVAPVSFRSANASFDRFVKEFFDGYLLSGIACDHEYFGNNPYRHAYCPGAIDLTARGYLTSSRRGWSAVQGDIEQRWRNHIRRTLREGMVSPERPAILLDSGVWQDACGYTTHDSLSLGLNANFVTACCLVCLKSGDRRFAKEIFPSLQCILRPVEQFDPDHDGLLESPLPGTPGSPSSSYNDTLSTGHKDGYLNAAVCEALQIYGSLAEWLQEGDQAAQARRLAAGIRKAFNEQLWLERAGHYAGWIDLHGKPHDSWYTQVNFMATAAGIVPPARLARMMQSFIAHPNHHRIFAAGWNLDPVTDGSYRGNSAFGIWLNGGVLLGPVAYELIARARGLGGQSAWEMLHDLEVTWQKNHLAQIPMIDWVRNQFGLISRSPRLQYTGGNAWTWIDGIGPTGAGTETYLSDGGAILWALYTGVLGIQPDFQGILFEPHIPAALADVRAEVRLLGRCLTLQVRGSGDTLESLVVNGDPASPRVLWSRLDDGSQIVATMR